MTNWVELHRLNRLWRQWMDARSSFMTPETIDCLRYARVEANEAADLEMRKRLYQHARNNERQHTVPQELAQVAMLVLTALPKIDFEKAVEDRLFHSELPAIDSICDLANSAVVECVQNFDYWRAYAHALLMTIETRPGFDANTHLRQCWSALAWKHASQHMHEYPEELK